MRFPLSWLKDYIHLTQSPEQIAKILTSLGIEVEELETKNFSFDGIVVGEVLETQKHPDADKLCVATVSDGKNNFQVVCGASNCRKGLKTAFAREGATLKDEKGTFTIKKTKLRGVESSGMLCSGKELNLTQESEGILEFPSDTPVGISIKDLYQDTIIEVGLTPNLAHCLSLIGIARELSAATGLSLQSPKTILKEGHSSINDAVKLTVEDPKGCPRYTCRLIKNVKIGPSPEWLRSRIEKSGLRSINNVVDVTNYVLMEMGHPLHAFDYDRLEGKEIVVKRAQEGEHFTTLDGNERVLVKDDLLICDGNRPVALAGIMGGLNSEVSKETTNVLLESAYFDPVVIRKTSKRQGIQSDSSKRFERGTDPNNIINALDRAASLIAEVGNGEISLGICEAKAKEFPNKVIKCRLQRVNEILGLSISRGELESIFQRLHFRCSWDSTDTIVVDVPTYRVDIQSEIDLIEEAARLYGYDNIPRKKAAYHASDLADAPIYLFEKTVQERLIAEGLQEFLTCDLIGPTLLNIVHDISMQPQSMVSVLNPTSVEQSILRTSLLPGLLQVVKHNIDHQNNQINGFEVGRIHFKDGNQYKEQSVLGIILSGKSNAMHWCDKPQDFDFYDLKGIVENVLSELGILNPIYKNLGIDTFHTGRQASIFIDTLEIGSLGEIHPAIQRRLDVPQRILFAEFNLHDLIQLRKKQKKVKALPIYPSSERDWTLTIRQAVPFAKVLQDIKEVAPSFLENVYLLDIFRHERLGGDYQNMTIRFVYRDSNKTIDQETVDKEHQKIVTGVTTRLGEALKT